jgi:hypothetical protein
LDSAEGIWAAATRCRLSANAYIEAFHSNLQREVIDRYEFDSIYHAQMVIDRYYEWYNKKGGMAPQGTPFWIFNNTKRPKLPTNDIQLPSVGKIRSWLI